MLALRSSRLLRTSSTFLLRQSSRALSTSYPPHEIVPLPALSPTMEFGGIARWSKKVGDPIIAGDILVEVETDKATVDFEAQDDAFLAKILINEGTSDLPVGTPIAVLVEEEEDVAAFVDFVAPSMVVDTPVAAAPVVAAAAAAAAAGAPSSSSSSSHSGRVPRIQFRHGLRSEIDVAMGRSSSAVSPVSAAAAVAAAATNHAATPEGDARGFTDINLTAMRKIIAARLTESKATIPHYYTRMECNIDMMLEYRKILKIAGVKVSVNDLVIVAAALALRDVPEANSFWDGSSIQQNATVDISVAVATDGGLITPIVRDADRIGLSVSCLFVCCGSCCCCCCCCGGGGGGGLFCMCKSFRALIINSFFPSWLFFPLHPSTK